jgi:DNA-binding GntR family transcriptional regulator
MPEPSAASAYHRLRRAIVEGDYRPGERLIEQRIAEDLEVSRTPVREAFRMLQAEGLVRIEPNRGAAVRDLTVDGIADLYELRARLEAYAAELAAERATDDQRQRLREASAAFDEAVRHAAGEGIDGIRSVFGLNDVFHLTMLEAARHDRLAHELFRTVDHPLVFQAFRQYSPDAMARSSQFHRLICDAIGAGEVARAGRLAHEHVLHGRDVLITAVGKLVSVGALFDPAPDAPAAGR